MVLAAVAVSFALRAPSAGPPPANASMFNLDLGQMNPVTVPEGQIQRLLNMGYDCGLNKRKGLPQAPRSFQADNGIPVNGEADAATRAKLVEEHGS